MAKFRSIARAIVAGSRDRNKAPGGKLWNTPTEQIDGRSRGLRISRFAGLSSYDCTHSQHRKCAKLSCPCECHVGGLK